MALIQVVHVHNTPDREALSDGFSLAAETRILVQNERIKMHATALMSMGYVIATAVYVALVAWALTADITKDMRGYVAAGLLVVSAILAIALFWMANSRLGQLRVK